MRDVSLNYKEVLSLSVRRAWIEIPITLDSGALPGVALRKESVDRNFYYSDKDADWVRVALRKESVDRNALGGWGRGPQGCRSP